MHSKGQDEEWGHFEQYSGFGGWAAIIAMMERPSYFAGLQRRDTSAPAIARLCGQWLVTRHDRAMPNAEDWNPCRLSSRPDSAAPCQPIILGIEMRFDCNGKPCATRSNDPVPPNLISDMDGLALVSPQRKESPRAWWRLNKRYATAQNHYYWVPK